MKWPIGILTALLLMSFSNIKPGKNRDLKVVSAEKQTVFGGVAGSPVVTVYRMQLKALRSFHFAPDTAFAEGKADKIHISTDSFHNVGERKVKKGELLNIYFEISTASEMGGGDYQEKIPGSPDAKAPIGLKNGVVLRYSGGKCKYLGNSNIVSKETIFSP